MYAGPGLTVGAPIGGDDFITGGDDATFNFMYGDALSMSAAATGGNDRVIGGNRSYNHMNGDADNLGGESQGGDDNLLGGGVGATNLVLGDGWSMGGNAAGGNDVVCGGVGAVVNSLHGDPPVTLSDNARGGDDTLMSAAGTHDEMWGDAETIYDSAIGGCDKFDSLPGNGGQHNSLTSNRTETTIELHWLPGISNLRVWTSTAMAKAEALSTFTMATPIYSARCHFADGRRLLFLE